MPPGGMGSELRVVSEKIQAQGVLFFEIYLSQDIDLWIFAWYIAIEALNEYKILEQKILVTLLTRR